MKKLLSLTNSIDENQSKTNIFHGLFVNENFEKLLIKFSYFPKEMSDDCKALQLISDALQIYAPTPFDKSYGNAQDFLPIVNLLTLSLDAPDGYRGVAHRYSPVQEHILSCDFASPGFYRGEIIKGRLELVVNAHCVCSDFCTYSIEVFGEEFK